MNLYQHQTEALERTAKFPNVAYFHDMGLGKTFTGAEKMRQYDNKVNLVICQKSKVSDWVEHFKTYYHQNVFDLTKTKQFGEFYGLVMGGRFSAIGVINYELAWRRKDLLNCTQFTLMLDESSLIQNPKAKQTKFILKLKPKNVILLSGTPTVGKYENLWTQAHLLGWAISEELYNKHYVNWTYIESDGFTHKVVDKEEPYKNVERLKQRFRDFGADFLKTDEVFDLPEQTFTMVHVPTTKTYRTFMKDSYVMMADGTELIGDQIFKKRLYARQLCSIWNADKLNAFREILQSTNDRLIVFYNFKAEVQQLIHIANELQKPWSIVSGDTKSLAAYENYDDSVTFIQYQAGAMGLNLQKANKMVYFTLPERSDLFEQSKKRIHRIGQKQPCFYWILSCDNSVDEQIYATLQERKDFTDELFEMGI